MSGGLKMEESDWLSGFQDHTFSSVNLKDAPPPGVSLRNRSDC